MTRYVLLVLLLPVAGVIHAAPGDSVEFANPTLSADADENGVPDGWGFSAVKQTNATCAIEPGGGPEGADCVRIDCPAEADHGLLQQHVTIKPDTMYRFVAWLKATEGLTVTLSASSYDAERRWLAADYEVIEITGGGEWVQRAGYSRTHAGAASINLGLWANWHSHTPGSGWFGGVQITEVDAIPDREYAPANPPFEFSAADRRAGLMLLQRSYLNLLPQNYRPTEAERLERIEIAASLGEYEPAVVSLHAARDLEQVTCAVSDLVGPGGAVIGGEELGLHVVRYLLKPSHYSRQDKWLVPCYLAPGDAQPAQAGRCAQFWLTVHVPEDTAPGEYAGTVTVTGDGDPVSVPLRLTVWPIRLIEPEDRFVGFYDTHSEMRTVEDPTAWKYADMRAHGMTTVGYYGRLNATISGEPGAIALDLAISTLAQDFDRYVQAGFPMPLVWLMDGSVRAYASKFGEPGTEAFEAAYAETIGRIEEQRRERGWPEIYYQPQDEVFHKEESFQVALSELRALRRAGVKTEMDGPNTHHERGAIAYPLTDMMVNVYGPLFYRERVYGRDEWAAMVRQYHADGKKILYYNFDTTGYHPECMRFANGFYIAATGCDGLLNWAFGGPGNTYGEKDPEGVARTINFYFPQTEAEIGGPSTAYEAMREGTDDLRYWHTLRTLADRAPRQQAAEAERLLAELFDDLDISGLRTNMSLQGDWTDSTLDDSLREAPSGEYKLGVSWSKATYDQKRRLLAEAIMRLQQ